MKKELKGVVEHAKTNETESGIYLPDETLNALQNRLSRIQGHVRSLKRMLAQKKCVDDILLQVGAIKSALNSFSKILIEEEMTACMSSCMDGSQDEKLKRITRAISLVMKHS